MNRINHFTIERALKGLAGKEFSSIELTRSCLNRINSLNKETNAFITVCEEEALKDAKKADELASQGETLEAKPLLGIPIALKDLYLTKGIRTTAAAKVLENYIPQYDATVVKKLKAAGAVIIGKTNCDAWAHGSSGENSDFLPSKNPYDTSRTPGGSSSGSAVAVASSMALAAMGTDTGGSIRLPASFCNLVGLKPTYGRVSRYGVIPMASSLDSIGHLTKTVYDNALLLSVTAGKDPFDATSVPVAVPDYMKHMKNGVKGLRIGISQEYFIKGIDPKVVKVIDDAMKQYKKLGAEVIELSLPHTEYALAVYYIVVFSETSSNLARYDGIRYGYDRSKFGSEAKRRIMLGSHTLSSGYYDAYYLKAMKVRTLIKKDFDAAFEKVDVILAPVSPTLPFKLGEKVNDPLSMYLSDIFTITSNLAGVPSIAVPAGFIDGLPVGFQLIGKHFHEDMLYRFAFTYEQETKWHEREPKL